jgi:hypothetical protein
MNILYTCANLVAESRKVMDTPRTSQHPQSAECVRGPGQKDMVFTHDGQPSFEFVAHHPASAWNPRSANTAYNFNILNHASNNQILPSCSRVANERLNSEFDFVDQMSIDLLETGSSSHSRSFESFAQPSQPLHTPVVTTSDLVATLTRIDKFVKDTNQPWHPPTIAPSTGKIKAPYFSGTNADFHTYRPGSTSELESTVYYLSDSGYYTAPPANSIKSGSYNNFSPDLSNLDAPLADFNMSSIPEIGLSHTYNDGPDDDQKSSKLSASATTKAKTRGGKKTCQKCGKESKCPSDYKYVVVIHL